MSSTLFRPAMVSFVDHLKTLQKWYAPRDLHWMIPLLLIVTAPLWLGPIKAFLRPPSGGLPTGSESQVVQQTFTMVAPDIFHNRDGKRQLRVKAAEARTGVDENELLLDMVFAKFYDADNQETIITSEKARYVMNREVLDLKTNVIIRPPGGHEITTDFLTYDQKKNFITSSEPVHISSKDISVRGNRMTYDINAGKLVLTGKVVCILTGSFAALENS